MRRGDASGRRGRGTRKHKQRKSSSSIGDFENFNTVQSPASAAVRSASRSPLVTQHIPSAMTLSDDSEIPTYEYRPSTGTIAPGGA